jgi:hypothetical protein
VRVEQLERRHDDPSSDGGNGGPDHRTG